MCNVSNSTENFNQNSTDFNIQNHTEYGFQNCSLDPLNTTQFLSPIDVYRDIFLSLRNYGSIGQFIVGLTFNLFSIYYLSCKKNRTKDCTIKYYLIALLAACQIQLFLEMPFDMFIKDVPDSFCNILIWLRYSCKEISSWLLVIMVIDRTIISRLENITELTDSRTNTDSANLWRIVTISTIYFIFLIKNGIFLIINWMSAFEFFRFMK